MSRADDDDAGAAGIKEWRTTEADDDDAGVAGIKERRAWHQPTTMMPAQPGSRSGPCGISRRR
jgi:hypothetical protein